MGLRLFGAVCTTLRRYRPGGFRARGGWGHKMPTVAPSSAREASSKHSRLSPCRWGLSTYCSTPDHHIEVDRGRRRHHLQRNPWLARRHLEFLFRAEAFKRGVVDVLEGRGVVDGFSIHFTDRLTAYKEMRSILIASPNGAPLYACEAISIAATRAPMAEGSVSRCSQVSPLVSPNSSRLAEPPNRASVRRVRSNAIACPQRGLGPMSWRCVQNFSPNAQVPESTCAIRGGANC